MHQQLIPWFARQCFTLCLPNSAKMSYLLHARLTGDVDHFQSEQKDTGWGCGWRNIQMVCSHLLRHDEVRALVADCYLVNQVCAVVSHK